MKLHHGATLGATLPLLSAVTGGATTCKSLTKRLKKNKSNISRMVKKCIEDGYLEKIGYPYILEVTGKGKVLLLREKKGVARSSLGVRLKKTRSHTLTLKFPIVQDNSSVDWDKINDKFRNSLKYYKLIKFPIGITIEKTSRSIILHLHEKEIERKLFLTEFMSWGFKATFYAYNYLSKRGVEFDVLAGGVTQQHIANPDPELNDKTDKQLTITQPLGRGASAFYPFVVKGKQVKAQAWIDRSLGDVEIETNDLIFEEKLILMPEKVFDIDETVNSLEERQGRFEKNIDLYSKNIELHLSVMKDMRDTLKLIQKNLKKEK